MSTRARFAEVVRSEPLDLGLACLLVGGEVEPDLDVDLPLALLDAHAAAARAHVPVGARPLQVAEGLRRALGEEAGFAGFAEDYTDLRSSLLHEVLLRQRGLPLTLSVVWTEVAARLDQPAYLVALPGHVVVGLGDPDDDHVLVDPFAGGRLVPLEEVDRRLQATTGRGVTEDDLRPAPPDAVLLRLLLNVRALTTRQDRLLESARTRLWAVELSLLLPRHPVGLRRERGELLVRVGQHLRGAAELEAFAAAVDDADPVQAEQARREAGLARSRLN
ncbi:MAG: putative transcriptional regulator [Frankiales bacterium]|nr:putative transcriptional regulator [Frankiales bacterium]